ncbi:MAG: Rne/Rng family ribonuclease [Actinobacteria bacterium]|nr:Rne/Rng family ribonuclease [Actinomycetota bacterium]
MTTRNDTEEETSKAAEDAGGEHTSTTRVRTRTRSRSRSEDAAPDAGGDAASDSDAAAEGSDDSRRERSRGGRKRSKGKSGSSRSRSKSDAATDDGGDGDDLEKAISRGGTRVAAKRRGDGGGNRRSSGRSGGRRKAELPDDVRRAVLEGSPRSMLVTNAGQRVQIAVLEERTLVEHYVTRADERSYVGNIYMARVQNVLPGMEAAFLDIGKGRNGVLYAGEVLYDEADLEDGSPRIEEALKSGQTVLVQVTKDPMGSKGARLTQHLSLAGRYMVLAPNSELFGISRKLPDEERDRLRKILKQLKPEEHGVIVRTAAESATDEQLERDLDRLLAKWEAIKGAADEAKALDAVYEEPTLVVRVIRDNFGPEFTELVVDDAELHKEVESYLEEIDPDQLPKLKLYAPAPDEGDEPQKLFDAYHVTEQIKKALDRKVWLPSGGYLIIEKTEAMTIIDVNTGRFTGKDNLEETVLKTNLEAAEEAVRQLRLRDIGGIIIVDFIDMLLKANQDQVVNRLKRELLRDRTKTRVSEVSRLGLVQMTRKNVSQGLVESYSEKCDRCNGHGFIIRADF